MKKKKTQTQNKRSKDMGNLHRVMVIADGDNAFMAAQSFNRKINWHKVRDYLADPKEGRELIEMVIYIGLPPAKERFEEQRKNKEKFVYWAKSNGFLVVVREGKAKGDDYENNVDVVMAIDAIELALEIKPDIVVLVTGDSDFAYLAEKLRRRGIRVEVASVEQSLGSELKNSANSVVDLTEVFDKFDQHDTSQNYYRIGSSNVFDS
ncbi:NYN domain-containing protein [Nostoc sp. MG11]|uniref:LabA-like NYN domain-containing protein n=1 Tax=Nostoc sp. MG11 TaxID=2721166 RepID=UPI001D026B00|nr:NYN domain-containing protein [Nostoc sp. MG11]